MPTALPRTEQIRLECDGPVLRLWLDRPAARNAMSHQMSDEIQATFDAIGDDRTVRVVVIRGRGGVFCAGGDIKAMSGASAPPPTGERDPLETGNRRFGAMLETVDNAPQAVVAVVEGHAIGGGFGLACIADVTIARADALFAMSEVTLGIVPAAISPFVVQRVGLTAARRLGVSGARLNGAEAVGLGIAHMSAADPVALEDALRTTVNLILRCAPGAVAETKRLMHRAAGRAPMADLLDLAASSFAAAVRGPEGREGTRAFVEKRKPSWVTQVE